MNELKTEGTCKCFDRGNKRSMISWLKRK
jgi:hypothetical protein